LKQFIEAEQDLQDNFCFPSLGPLQRTIQNVNDAASKLNLDRDKISAALFWFYDGKTTLKTDEDAFLAIKDADLDQVLNIWTKLTSNGEVSQLNASAYNNLGTLYLSGILEGTNTKEALLEQGVSLKLKFLESDFIKDFKALATDETYKTTKKELQLLFLYQVQSEIENNRSVSLNKFLDIINRQQFAAKEDFLKGFIQKPIEQIEIKIEEAKTKRKAIKANAYNIGEDLLKQTTENLNQLKSILGASNIKYTSLADKVANEILQCSIDYFNYYQENESDINYFEPAYKLAKLSNAIAIGNLTKDRIKDSLTTLEKIKDKVVLQIIQFLKSIKYSYEENKTKIQQHVKELEENDKEIRFGLKSINYSAVEDKIKNSINWQTVNELLNTTLSDTNLKKIKESNNNKLKIEFLDLANWLNKYSLKNSTINEIINKYNKLPPKLPFIILSSEITNTNNKPLYTKFIRYISINLKVQVTQENSVTFYIKVIKPDGSIKRNSNTSPSGYTTTETHYFSWFDNTIKILNWGNKDKCVYDIGEHLIEVYVDDYLIHRTNFNVDITPTEKLEIELKKAEEKMKEINNTQYLKSEISNAQYEMNRINRWQFLRSQSNKEKQINDQQQKINNTLKMAEKEKYSQIKKQQTVINEIKIKIQNSE